MKLRLLLIVFIIGIFVAGCDSQGVNEKKKNEIPEPYKLALDDIKNQDYASSYRYLELTISDFPESKYINDAHFLHAIITSGYISTNSALMDNLHKGVVKAKIDNSNIELLMYYVNTLSKQIDGLEEKITLDVNYLINTDLNSLNVKYFDFNKSTNPKEKEPFEYFKNIGYPVPMQDDFDTTKTNWEILIITNEIKKVVKQDGLDLPCFYSSLLGKSLYMGLDKTIQKQLADKIMFLTENDKYNKIRLDTEELIKKNKLDVPQNKKENDNTSNNALSVSDAKEIINKLKLINAEKNKLILLEDKDLTNVKIPNKNNYYIFEVLDKYDTAADYVYCVNKYNCKIYKYYPDGKTVAIN